MSQAQGLIYPRQVLHYYIVSLALNNWILKNLAKKDSNFETLFCVPKFKVKCRSARRNLTGVKIYSLYSELQIHEHKKQTASRSHETNQEQLIDHMVNKTIIENVDPFLRHSHQVPLVQFVECNGHISYFAQLGTSSPLIQKRHLQAVPWSVDVGVPEDFDLLKMLKDHRQN